MHRLGARAAARGYLTGRHADRRGHRRRRHTVSTWIDSPPAPSAPTTGSSTIIGHLEAGAPARFTSHDQPPPGRQSTIGVSQHPSYRAPQSPLSLPARALRSSHPPISPLLDHGCSWPYTWMQVFALHLSSPFLLTSLFLTVPLMSADPWVPAPWRKIHGWWPQESRSSPPARISHHCNPMLGA